MDDQGLIFGAVVFVICWVFLFTVMIVEYIRNRMDR